MEPISATQLGLELEEQSYSIEDGIITSPGKFEGEPRYAVYFWEEASPDEQISFPDDQSYWLVEILEKDRERFPEIDREATVMVLEESEQGFVSCAAFTAEQLEALREQHRSLRDPEEGTSS